MTRHHRTVRTTFHQFREILDNLTVFDERPYYPGVGKQYLTASDGVDD